LVQEIALPPDSWSGIDIEEYRTCRQVKVGKERAARFFRQHMNIAVERSVIQSLLFDQLDYMKRLRKGGGARDILDPEGISLRRKNESYTSADGRTRTYNFWVASKTRP